MKRSAFTLIELLIAIVIIATLLALLIPSVSSIRNNVRVSEVRMEISQLESAIAEFKSEMGSELPSQIHLYESLSGWTSGTGDPSNPDAASKYRSIIKGIWPQFDFSQPRDFNGDGDTNDWYILKGDQALVFFLGGAWDPERGFQGFNSNPTRPFGFSPSGVRQMSGTTIGPFFEFDLNRTFSAASIDYQFFDDGALGGTCLTWFPVYADPLPNQVRPYIYSANTGFGYNDSYPELNSDANTSAAVNSGMMESQPRTNGFRAYRRSGPTPSAPTASIVYWKPKSYQIISPGFDGLYGEGGIFYDSGNTRFPTSPNMTSSDRWKYERDNVTNFANGMLQP